MITRKEFQKLKIGDRVLLTSLSGHGRSTIENFANREVVIGGKSNVSCVFYARRVGGILPPLMDWRDIEAIMPPDIKQKFDPYGIIIDTVNFTDISVDDETAAAIQKKVTAQQEMELASIEAQTAKIQAEKDKQVAEVAAEQRIVEANAKAEAMRINAEAEADATRIRANAESEANRVIAASLTKDLIEKIKYEQWDGQLPKVTGGGATIVDIEP